jgi:hypothetical protein
MLLIQFVVFAISTSDCLAMKIQMTFTSEVLTCCTLYNHPDYYLTLLDIYEHLNMLKNNLALLAMYSYNLYPSEPDSSLGFFLASYLSRELFLLLLYLHCLLFGVLGWVSVKALCDNH